MMAVERCVVPLPLILLAQKHYGAMLKGKIWATNDEFTNIYV